MNLHKRIKKIISLTMDDFLNSGNSTTESKDSLIKWLTNTLLKINNIEDFYVHEVSLKVLEMLNSLEIVDLEFIHEILLKEYEVKATITINVDEVIV